VTRKKKVIEELARKKKLGDEKVGCVFVCGPSFDFVPGVPRFRRRF
jgi:hypothetical protein